MSGLSFASRSADLSSRIAVLALAAGAIGIAFSPIFVRLSEVGPIATAVHRLALGLPVFWLWLAAEGGGGRKRGPTNWRDAGTLILAGLFFAGDLACWHWSLGFTTVANATLLANNAPIFVTLGAWILWRERPSRSFAAGLVVALAGVILLTGRSFAPGQGTALIGDGLALLTGMFYSAYFLTVKRLRAEFTTAAIMTWSAVVGAVLLLPTAILVEGVLWPVSLGGWLVVLGLALFSHVGGQSLITYAMAHLPAGFSAVGLLLQPVAAAVFAWILFGEALSPTQMTGGAVVLLGIWLARR